MYVGRSQVKLVWCGFWGQCVARSSRHKYLTLLVGCGAVAAGGDLMVHGQASDRRVWPVLTTIELWLTRDRVGRLCRQVDLLSVSKRTLQHRTALYWVISVISACQRQRTAPQTKILRFGCSKTKWFMLIDKLSADWTVADSLRWPGHRVRQDRWRLC